MLGVSNLFHSILCSWRCISSDRSRRTPYKEAYLLSITPCLLTFKMSQLSTISLASSTIGFISFAFTFFTFLRVFWETILTLLSAPKQMKGYLDNLRLEIHNERAYFESALRRTKSRSRSVKKYHVDGVKKYHEDEQPLRTLNSVSDRSFGINLSQSEQYVKLQDIPKEH